MRCEHARLGLSVALDETLSDAEAGELSGACRGLPRLCSAGTGMARAAEPAARRGGRSDARRRAARVAAISTTSDAHRPRRRMSWRMMPVPLVATFVAGVLVGASVMVVNRPAEVVASRHRRPRARGPARLETLAADVRIVERGWNPDVPARHVPAGRCDTRRPSRSGSGSRTRPVAPRRSWRANDTDLVITEGRWWSPGRAPALCSSSPGARSTSRACRARTSRAVRGDSAAPLDMVLPARSFSVPTGTTRLRTATMAGRSAIGLRTTVAEVTPILTGLRSDLRELARPLSG